jgi:hypothetical protein
MGTFVPSYSQKISKVSHGGLCILMHVSWQPMQTTCMPYMECVYSCHPHDLSFTLCMSRRAPTFFTLSQIDIKKVKWYQVQSKGKIKTLYNVYDGNGLGEWSWPLAFPQPPESQSLTHFHLHWDRQGFKLWLSLTTRCDLGKAIPPAPSSVFSFATWR